ncbi:MAG: ABC transporter permease [Saprospiraceae bacterium]|nr:ABC transporter permease [Saprospiraceae bacterium]
MIKNYIQFAFRNLFKQKTYSFINIAGLAVGMACFILIALFVQDELSFENFHAKAERLYRISTPISARTAPLLAPTLKQDIPEVESAVRLLRYFGTIHSENQQFNEDKLFFAEPDFLNMFSLDFEAGLTTPNLEAPNTILVSESIAKKYFGEQNALGKILFLDTTQFNVVGVFRDLPINTHLAVDMVASFKTLEQSGRNLDTWSNNIYYTYALLKEKISPQQFQNQTNTLVEKYIYVLPNRADYTLVAQNIKDIHLNSNKDMELTANGSMKHIYIFGSIAFIVLFVAGINYVNLATARATQRAKEVGVRKAIGADFRQLATQFLSESILLSLIALLIAGILVEVSLPVLNQLSGKTISSLILIQPLTLVLTLSFALLIGLLAGIYPAFVLSSFRPYEVLKGKIKTNWNEFLIRRGLVVLQFSLSMMLIVGAGTVYKQLNYMKDRSLGFDREQMLILPFNWNGTVQNKYEILKEQFLQNPNIISVTSSGDIPGRMATTMSYWAEGMPQDESRSIQALYVHDDFVQTYGIEMLAGRAFEKNIASDSSEGFLLNEQAIATFGWTPEEAIGKRFSVEKEGRVVGVIKDFHYNSLHQSVAPLFLSIRPDWCGYLSLRINTENAAQTIANIEQIWKKMIPEVPLEHYFLDEDFNNQYLAENRLSKIVLIFSTLAIFIAAIGLFGLATFTIERRTKEIAVRKVLGANVGNILSMLAKDFGKPILVAILLAIPATLWIINQWLSNFAYHIKLPVALFIIGGFAIFVIAALSISFQSVRATRVNPVKWLRNE